MNSPHVAKSILQEVGLWSEHHPKPQNRYTSQLSGGMRRRLSIAIALTGNPKVVFLDEPTTGLHTHDVAKLITILNRLVEQGNTVIVIEHNLDVIKVADYIIDLGPEGGDGGGTVVAEGTPEEVSENPNSFTGIFLKDILKK